MGISYNEFLERLKNERLRYHITQKEMSGELKIIQNHYSKIESGKKRLTYYEINNLCSTDVDVYYIFTGNSSKKNKCKQVEYRHAIYCLKLINLLAHNKCSHATKNQDDWKEIYLKTQYVNYMDISFARRRNIFYAVRTDLGYSQIEMAKSIGVDVKKLRNLECGRVLPDSEIIFNMYQNYGVSPSVFLQNSQCVQREISYLVESADNEIEDMLNECVAFVMEHW